MLESYSTAERYDDESIRERRARDELQKKYEDMAELNEALKEFDKVVNLQGVPLANPDEEGFSGDGASLFTLVNVERDGVTKTCLMKLGWGEFSHDVFRKGANSKFSDHVPKYQDGPDFRLVARGKLLKELPFQMFCVSQRDSYLADKVETLEEMAYNPVSYLKENSLFATEDGQVTPADRSFENRKNPAIHGLPNYEFKVYSEQEILETLEELRVRYQEIVERMQQEYFNSMSNSMEND